jgi:beta-phosphoglucomutase-like phosphatase (HAD superfamily)
MKQYDVYIFDLDGTITDTTAVWIQIFRECLEKLGVDTSVIADDEIAKHTHDWKATIDLGLSPDDVPKLAEYAKELANKRLPSAEQFPRAYETLEAIRAKGKKLAIFSTMDRPIFEPAMEHNNLYDVAQATVAGTDVPNRKPAPDGILKALEDLGVSEKEYSRVMYMGDKDTDIQAAHNAGIDAILFYPPIHQEIYDKDAVLAHSPEAVIADWQELLESLQ